MEIDRLQNEMERIKAEGVGADRRQLKQDMKSQFTDPLVCIRELVVNAYDADANFCWVSGREEGERIVLIVQDDGAGMDRQGLVDYFHLFRSRKGAAAGRDPVGCFGVGKLSVAALPGQEAFSVTTCTGTEAWRAVAGPLLGDDPIRIEPVRPLPDKGSRFEITIARQMPLSQLLERCHQVLRQYLGRLPFTTVICDSDGGDPRALTGARWVKGVWYDPGQESGFQRRYRFELAGVPYDVVLSVGTARHELYQKKVFVTDRYDLLAADLSGGKGGKVDHLDLRVDSPGFELPFGRHRLSNEQVLTPLSHHLRTRVLPRFLEELFGLYDAGLNREMGIASEVVEDIAVCLLLQEPGRWHAICGRLPVFATHNRGRISIAQASEAARRHGVLYLENKATAGIDYGRLEAPVFCLEQPADRFQLLRDRFGPKLVDLGDRDSAVRESGPDGADGLTDRERHFQKTLGLHPLALAAHGKRGRRGPTAKELEMEMIADALRFMDKARGSMEELSASRRELADLKWRVNRLLEPDGTPCRAHRFIVRDGAVVLNLHHEEVQRLIRLGDRAPALAGHWATALCLTDQNRLLPHLSPDVREDILMLDAIARCGGEPAEGPADVDAQAGPHVREKLKDLLRDLEDTALWMR